MLKKYFFVFCLLSLYIAVMVNGAIPHHQHTEKHQTQKHHGHSDHENHHHHDSDSQKSENDSKGDVDPFLALHILLGHTQQVFFKNEISTILIKVKKVDPLLAINHTITFPLKFPDSESSEIPPEPDHYSFAFLSSSGLRAPPALA